MVVKILVCPKNIADVKVREAERARNAGKTEMTSSDAETRPAGTTSGLSEGSGRMRGGGITESAQSAGTSSATAGPEGETRKQGEMTGTFTAAAAALLQNRTKQVQLSVN